MKRICTQVLSRIAILQLQKVISSETDFNRKSLIEHFYLITKTGHFGDSTRIIMFNLGLKHAMALRKLTGTICSLFYMVAGTCSKVKCGNKQILT